MRYIFTCAFALACLFPAIAGADIFVKRDAPQSSDAPKVYNPFSGPDNDLERALDLNDKDKPQNTDPKVAGKNLANQYYKNCLKQPAGIMSADSHKALCGCTAAQMVETMSVDEIQTMFTQTKEGNFQRQRMMALVYIPCMEYPVEDMVVNHCMSQPEVTKGLKKAREVCGCLGNDMGKFVVKAGGVMAKEEMIKDAQNMNVQQMLADLMSSKIFAQKSKTSITTCMQKHELGW